MWLRCICLKAFAFLFIHSNQLIHMVDRVFLLWVSIDMSLNMDANKCLERKTRWKQIRADVWQKNNRLFWGKGMIFDVWHAISHIFLQTASSVKKTFRKIQFLLSFMSKTFKYSIFWYFIVNLLVRLNEDVGTHCGFWIPSQDLMNWQWKLSHL